ncbi:bifunctional DNA primase/polymerase [Paractinoplanes atraurantiacus]|uniref:Bifunctional DNA primase/polymerase, N-terminal n=1 Tax=Paractinoplanes atraurantiacus TaxID=1036182 RepID=A0A285IWI2_9ACTN|nr:bifunctional DNA primase/polymerase [Actinoplanes atraurantiacus]SNY52027.1 Bifunctional DNA primase/polymerase, N-terminal [Actinoplanes atraurantiacus]
MTGGHWIAASKALGRRVPADGPYPHICDRTVAAEDTVSGEPLQVARWERPRYCAACAEAAPGRKFSRRTRGAPPPSPEIFPSTPDTRRPEPMPDNGSLRDVALAAAERGWHVFPLRPDDKRPAFPDHPADACTRTDPRCRDGHTGWEARATTDPDRIRRGWASTPYGVGIACGPSRLVVVDLDTPKDGQSAPAEWSDPLCRNGSDVFGLLCSGHDADGAAEVRSTYTVTTGRGGTHLYFRHPAAGAALRNTAGERGNGLGWLVDTRAHGGYVVAAGSTVAGRPYTVARDLPPAELPGWLAARLAPAPLPPQRPVSVDLPTGRAGAYLDAAIGRQLDHLRRAAEGERNHTLYVSAVALGQLAAGGALPAEQAADLLEQAALSIGLTRFETLRTIRSGLAAGARRPRTVAA